MKTRNVFQLIFLIIVFCLVTIILSGPLVMAADMPIPTISGNCDKCHDFSLHKMNNCGTCHDQGKFEPAAILNGGHGGLIVSDMSKIFSTAPVGNCKTCHDYINECEACHPSYFGYITPPALIPDPNPRWPANYTHESSRINNYAGVDNLYKCEMCHIQNQWPAIPQHNNSFGTPETHQNNGLSVSCQNCHTKYLTIEHNQKITVAGQPIDCFTCHASSRDDIKLAIKNKDNNCGTCHKTYHLSDHNSSQLDETCNKCHISNLLKEHTENIDTQKTLKNCSDCHSNTKPDVVASIEFGDTNCTSCHSTIHKLGFANNANDIPQMPDFAWSLPLTARVWAGEPWLQPEFNNGGRVLLSNSNAQITANLAWDYYSLQMPQKGWVLQSGAPAPGDTIFQATFTKANHKAVVYFTNTTAGKKIRIVYQ